MDTFIVSVLIGLLVLIGLMIIQSVYEIKMDGRIDELNHRLSAIEKQIKIIQYRIRDLERNSEADV